MKQAKALKKSHLTLIQGGQSEASAKRVVKMTVMFSGIQKIVISTNPKAVDKTFSDSVMEHQRPESFRLIDGVPCCDELECQCV